MINTKEITSAAKTIVKETLSIERLIEALSLQLNNSIEYSNQARETMFNERERLRKMQSSLLTALNYIDTAVEV